MSLIEDSRLLVLQPSWRESLQSDWVGRISLHHILFSELLTVGCRLGFPSALELDYTWRGANWRSQLKSSGIVQHNLFIDHPVVNAEIEVKATSSVESTSLSSSVSTKFANLRLNLNDPKQPVVGLYPKGPYSTEMILEWPLALGITFAPPDFGFAIRVTKTRSVDIGGRWVGGNAEFCSIASIASDGARCWRASVGFHLESLRSRLAVLVDSDRSVGVSIKDSGKQYGLVLWKLNKPSDSQRRRLPLGVSFFVEH